MCLCLEGDFFLKALPVACSYCVPFPTFNVETQVELHPTLMILRARWILMVNKSSVIPYLFIVLRTEYSIGPRTSYSRLPNMALMAAIARYSRFFTTSSDRKRT
jgi:hypothetical protein